VVPVLKGNTMERHHRKISK